MVRELRRTHLRLWLVLGPLVLVAAAMALLTRGPTAIPAAEQTEADSSVSESPAPSSPLPEPSDGGGP